MDLDEGSLEDTGSDVSQDSGTEANDNTQASKPAGYSPIDESTASPEQVKERIDYLYRQVKDSDREKREARQILKEQSRLIGELTSGMNNVVGHLQEKSYGDTESQLTATMQAAFEAGDTKAYTDAQTKLIKLGVEKQIAALRPKQEAPRQQNNMAGLADDAAAAGELTPEEATVTKAWMAETDERGQTLRPWAQASSPDYRNAIAEAEAIWENKRYANHTYEQKLAELDRRMGLARRTVTQNVMGGNLTMNKKSNKIALTEAQKQIAVKTNYAGKGKSAEDHYEAYRKQIANVRSSKVGARA